MNEFLRQDSEADNAMAEHEQRMARLNELLMQARRGGILGMFAEDELYNIYDAPYTLGGKSITTIIPNETYL